MVQESRTRVLNLQILFQITFVRGTGCFKFYRFDVYFKCIGLTAVINSPTDLMSTRYLKTIATIKSVVICTTQSYTDRHNHSKAFGNGLFGTEVRDWEKKKYSQVTLILRLILAK